MSPNKTHPFIFKAGQKQIRTPIPPSMKPKREEGKVETPNNTKTKNGAAETEFARSYEGWADWLRTKPVGVSEAEFEEEMVRVCGEVEATLGSNGAKREEGDGRKKEEGRQGKERVVEPGLFLGKRGGGRY
ncbi:hypothetical protein Vi05172_g2892 [Venturia inaequalis]|uniref:Uncharacterized protein n=1 Tax=Venturia inaequalis TaxID=5025 RepID=A0A8H3UW21_VENIN|nr:hypothetical protein EG327_008154 [Venturia inaequalis]RDI87379.1 hypothetical protein Vi05172_g2892 [Venturia inaequalis]